MPSTIDAMAMPLNELGWYPGGGYWGYCWYGCWYWPYCGGWGGYWPYWGGCVGGDCGGPSGSCGGGGQLDIRASSQTPISPPWSPWYGTGRVTARNGLGTVGL